LIRHTGRRQPVPPQTFTGKVSAPEFPSDLDWLNTTRPLTLQDVRGKLVLLDFWTFC
jgi:hypothetical protein